MISDDGLHPLVYLALLLAVVGHQALDDSAVDRVFPDFECQVAFAVSLDEGAGITLFFSICLDKWISIFQHFPTCLDSQNCPNLLVAARYVRPSGCFHPPPRLDLGRALVILFSDVPISDLEDKIGLPEKKWLWHALLWLSEGGVIVVSHLDAKIAFRPGSECFLSSFKVLAKFQFLQQLLVSHKDLLIGISTSPSHSSGLVQIQFLVLWHPSQGVCHFSISVRIVLNGRLASIFQRTIEPAVARFLGCLPRRN